MKNKPEIKYFQSKYDKLRGSSYKELSSKAYAIYNQSHVNKRRLAHVKSSYFKQKVFLDMFWRHLSNKPNQDRQRRIKYYQVAVDLIQHSRYSPLSTNKDKEFEFFGKTKSGEIFVVHIKKDSKGLHFMSCFPK